MFIIDSNVYIDGFNNLAFGLELQHFHRHNLPRLILSTVVAHELLIGAITAKQEHALRRGLFLPFQARRRIHTPSSRTWDLAASVDRRLRRKRTYQERLSQRSFFNDILISASARDLGATIITNKEKDFSVIAMVLDVRFKKPWP